MTSAVVLDYGVGNLFSLVGGLRAAGIPSHVEQDLDRALAADCLVLPGVGAFPVAAARLVDVRDLLRERLTSGLPCLAICLGMQLLFDRSEEGSGDGLSLLPGPVTRVRAGRVPHIGWNAVSSEHSLFARSGLGMAYFAHGFACRPLEPSSVIAWTTHEGDRFPAAVRRARTVGVQFHPEKSSRAGLAFLRAFWREVSE